MTRKQVYRVKINQKLEILPKRNLQAKKRENILSYDLQACFVCSIIWNKKLGKGKRDPRSFVRIKNKKENEEENNNYIFKKKNICYKKRQQTKLSLKIWMTVKTDW